MIKVEKNVPIPDSKAGRKNKYPFSTMKVGESFTVELHEQNNALTSGRSWALRHGFTVKFTSRRDGKKVRIWRSA